ncbi:MAG: helix-turn-helix domain-containing protein [Spirochaetales bacterium]|nr:helix-turn-helix domain-containing protein [Spirochaetales bacterium]
MESIGQKLMSAREALGYSIEQIARETNIAKSYLTALEAEDFESFPGETYILGFLRNYSEYLGIESEEMVSLYKNMKIQEQPVPMEELFEKRRSVSSGLVIIILVALGLAAAGYFYIYPRFFSGDRPVKQAVAEAAEEKAEIKSRDVVIRSLFEFSDEVVEKRFRKGDAVSVRIDDVAYNLVLAEITDKVAFIHPQGELEMTAGEEVLLDLNGDGSPDIRVLLRSFKAGSDSAVIHIDRFVQASSQSANPVARDSEHAETPEAAVPSSAAVGEAGAQSRVVKPTVIRSAARPESFTLNVIFRGYCFFRYHSDNSVREERYFHKGETFRLNADSEVRLWVSNAGALSSKVNGVDIDLGGSGEISTRSIKWIYNEENSNYELQLVPVY